MPKPDKITYKGKTMSVRKWAQRLNISTEGLSCRLKKGLAQKWSEKNGHWLKCISCSKLTKIEGAVKNGEREQKESWVSVQGQGGVGGN
jgi:hypothetical protein